MWPFIIGGIVALFAAKKAVAGSSAPSASPANTTAFVPLASANSSPVPSNWPKNREFFQLDANGNLLAIWNFENGQWVNVSVGKADRAIALPSAPRPAPALFNPVPGIVASAPNPTAPASPTQSGGITGGGFSGTGGRTKSFL